VQTSGAACAPRERKSAAPVASPRHRKGSPIPGRFV
jgi:hypothetical protein